MKIFTQLLLILFAVFFPIYGQEVEELTVPIGGVRLPIQVNGTDTVFLATLRELPVYAPLKFKNKKEEKFYWRTVRDVKRALPYAKLVSEEILATNKHLMTLATDKERKDYLSTYEKELFKKYEQDLKKMTFSQGKMLLKLIDRECDKTSYELIRNYRGGFSAVFWQGIAKIFGADLKSSYNVSKDEDRIIERVIVLVEAGLL